MEGTVNATLSYVAQAFRADNRPDPRLDVDGKMCFLLQEQMRGYRNQDGSKMKQKALPMSVLRKFHSIAVSSRDKALAQLMIGAIFFAMRSCEYLKTSAEPTKRTKIVRVGKILFKKGTIIMNHGNPQLETCDIVRITFEVQKNDRRDVSIHMFRSGDSILCPVKAWAHTVQRVRSIPGATDDSEVCLFHEEQASTPTLITAEYARLRLRAVVDLIGVETLGFSKLEVGLHSLRSGGAMAMFLSGTAVIVIMRVGRWSSEAFLEYIRDQVESFTVGVSKRMITCEEFYNLNVNTPENTSTPEHEPNDSAHTNNVDGPVSVPFGIRFSDLALNSNNRNRNKK